jgi:hypothetical protein
MDDPIERRHNATNARIRAGAKAGKYWLLRSESAGGGMTEKEREWLIQKILETTTSGAIGGFSMPMGVDKDDPALGGRNKFIKKQARFAKAGLLSRGSSR